MGMSLEEIVFLFTVSGLPWPPSRSVSASLHLYGGGGGGSGGKASLFLEPGVSHSVLKVLSARRDASPGFVSLPVSTSGCTPFVFCWGILHPGVDPGSVGVHAHLYVSELATMYARPPPPLKWISLWSSARSSRTIASSF